MNVFILEAGNGIPLLLAPLSLMIDIFTYGREREKKRERERVLILKLSAVPAFGQKEKQYDCIGET